MADRHGVVSFPGILSVVSGTYTNSHGITPGIAIVRFNPQPIMPASQGDLVFTDGIGTVRIPNCKIDEIRTEVGGGGQIIHTAFILDRRWKWGFGSLHGAYNQLDDTGKLIPWTIRSPRELIELCLGAMAGEINYTINVPPGLDRSFGAGMDRFQRAGENFPPTGVNPPVEWFGENPAIALQRVAEQFGCRVIYRVENDSVLITPIGTGSALPTTNAVSIYRMQPSIKDVPLPDSVRLIGAPIKYQMRLWMKNAVGEEWDGSIRPINDLSYAPNIAGRVQITRMYFSSRLTPFTQNHYYILTVNGVTLIGTGGIGQTSADVVTQVLATLSATTDARIRGTITATSTDAVTVELRGVAMGFAFEVSGFTNNDSTSREATATTDGASVTITRTQTARAQRRSWEDSQPWSGSNDGGFGDVEATDRLTRPQAIELARRSVFKWYQLGDQDVSGTGQINVPSFGRVERRQQIVITDTMCEQVVPAVPDARFRDTSTEDLAGEGERGGEFIPNYYNGLSRDKPAVAYGSHTRDTYVIMYETVNDNDTNTLGNEPIYGIGFTIDPLHQVIKFTDPVYYYEDDRKVRGAVITLETGVFVRDRETNQFLAYEPSRLVASAAGQTVNGPEVIRRPDVVMNIIGTYEFVRGGFRPDLPEYLQQQYSDFSSRLTRTNILEQDPLLRANYYLNAAMLKYQLKGAQTIEYNGIVPISCDGSIHQVTFAVGDGRKASTTASTNCEHSTYVPPFPTRRRAEAIAPPARDGGDRVDLAEEP